MMLTEIRREALLKYGTETDKLRMLFEKYGQHLSWCHSRQTVVGMATYCNCGFAAVARMVVISETPDAATGGPLVEGPTV